MTAMMAASVSRTITGTQADTLTVVLLIPARWTGSNSNPHNNDGQGRAGSDRSNVVLQRVQAYPEGTAAHDDKFGHWGRSYPDHVTNTSLLGLSVEDRLNLALLSSRECKEHA